MITGRQVNGFVKKIRLLVTELRNILQRCAKRFIEVLKMVKLHSSSVFVKDPKDVWGKEHTIGNAELAARLGSLVTFDRRGTVFAYDDFEDSPLKWTPVLTGNVGGGTGQSATLSNELPYRGSGSLKLVPPDVIGDYVYAYRYFGGVAKNMIGMELNINIYDTLNQKTQILFRVNTGSRLIHAGIRLQQDTSNGLSFLDNTGADPALDSSWTSFDTSFTIATNRAYPLKFVVDLENEKYVRCIFGGSEIDMSSYTPYAVASGNIQTVNAEAWVINGTTNNVKTYFDDFILTIEEPNND